MCFRFPQLTAGPSGFTAAPGEKRAAESREKKESAGRPGCAVGERIFEAMSRDPAAFDGFPDRVSDERCFRRTEPERGGFTDGVSGLHETGGRRSVSLEYIRKSGTGFPRFFSGKYAERQ